MKAKNNSVAEERVCKKCGEPLRSTSKRKYCENCRRNRIQTGKKGAALFLLMVLSNIPVVKHIVKKN